MYKKLLLVLLFIVSLFLFTPIYSFFGSLPECNDPKSYDKLSEPNKKIVYALSKNLNPKIINKIRYMTREDRNILDDKLIEFEKKYLWTKTYNIIVTVRLTISSYNCTDFLNSLPKY